MAAALPRCWRGYLSVFGAFLIQLTVGTYHGTFGNLLPYFSSYMRQESPWIGHGDLAQVFSTGGLAQGVSFMMGGLVLVPLLGRRGSMLLGCLMFTLAPLLSSFALDSGLATVCLSYGVLGAGAVNIIVLPTMLIPITWFPDSKGLVIGIVCSGFGLSSAVFSPLQTALINPANLPPLRDEDGSNSTLLYFAERQVLDNVPSALLYMSAIYAGLFLLGFILCVEKPVEVEEEKVALGQKLKDAFSYLVTETFRSRDFYLLFLTRFTMLTIGCATLAHWKNLTFTRSNDDKLVSVIGGVNGLMNCLSRCVAGALLDRLRYRHLMPTIAGLLCVVLLATFWVAQVSFPGLVLCIWLIYLLSFSHFSTVPAQAIQLFRHPLNSVVVGTIGLADTFAYAALGLLNATIMSRDSDPRMFLWLFLVLAAVSLVSLSACALVRCPRQGILSLPAAVTTVSAPVQDLEGRVNQSCTVSV